MRRLVMIILYILFSISMIGCSSKQGNIESDKPMSSELTISSNTAPSSDPPLISIKPTSGNKVISNDIPTNTSVNVAWGGSMCQANGCVYYVFVQNSENQSSNNKNPRAEIIRMNQDGSNPTAVTDTYDFINNLTADSNYLYFVGSGHSLYRLPLNGGKEQKILVGNFRELQCVEDRLYWEDFDIPTNENQRSANQIVSIKTDGSDLKTILAPSDSLVSEGPFQFVATEDGIYYSTSRSGERQTQVFHMDLSGANIVKLSSEALNRVNCLFYDQGTLYLLMDNDFAADPLSTSLVTLDQAGKIKTILEHTGYFEQDFAMIEFCGISNGIVYYFLPQHNNGMSANILVDLYQYDIKKDHDDLILRGVEMGNPAVGTITSLRGKSMQGAVIGMFILGNDIYYETFQMP